MYKRKVKILLSIGIGLLSVVGIMFAASQKLIADKKEVPQKPEEVVPMCYYIGPPALRAPEYPELIKKRNDLEVLYREGKINKETYEIRKEKVEEEIRLLNESYEKKNKEKD